MGLNVGYYLLISEPATKANSGSNGMDIIVFLEMDWSHITLSDRLTSRSEFLLGSVVLKNVSKI